MKNIFKKLLVLAVFVVSLATFAACKKNYKVTFVYGNGDKNLVQEVKKEGLVSKPDEHPTKEGYNFFGWYKSASDDSESNLFHFDKPIKGDVTVYASWTKDNVVLFNTKTVQSIQSVKVLNSSTEVNEPTAPAKAGFDFKGWYPTKVGKTWNSKEALKFPLKVENSTEIFAYYEPTNSKTHNWSLDETYRNTFTDMDTDPVLNPFTYSWSHESTLMSYLSTPLYSTDVDWDTAIKDGLAEYPGDFRKLNETNIGSLLREDILVGAASYPKALDGEHADQTGVNPDTGKYDPTISRLISASKYEIEIRPDMYWENGDNVTAADFVFTYLQFIDPIQNNTRGNTMFPGAARTGSGIKIVNSRDYRLQGSKIGGEGTAEDKAPYLADHCDYVVTKYIGEDTTNLHDYIGTWPFSSPAKLTYISKEEFDNNGYVIGKNQVYKGTDVSEAAITTYDFRCDVALNPYDRGVEGDTWPVFDKDKVGFKQTGKYTFTIEYEAPVQQASVMSFVNFTLVHSASYTNSLDNNKANSTYGTYLNQFISYGPYTIKSWSQKQKIILNKNYNSFSHLNHNYKSLSFDFYSNVDARMEGFDKGLIDVAGLTQDYYAQYINNPSLKHNQDGYPQYLIVNTRTYKDQNPEVANLIKNVDFRRALFFGFNRIEYTRDIYAPNVPSLVCYPINATQYDNDPEWYTQTPEYKAMLEDLNINTENFGYDPVKAKQYFDAAYKAWTDAGNTGPIELNYLTENSTFSEKLDNYIINSYVNLFGSGKIKFNRNALTQGAMTAAQKAFEFDITLSAVGTGSVTNTSVMLPVLALFYHEVYGTGFGFNTLSDLGIDRSVLIIDEENKLDLRSTYNFLKEKLDKNEWNEETDSGTLQPLYEILDRNNGYFIGNLEVLHEFGLECNYIWAGLAPQYDGDVEDRNTVTRAFDKIILEYAVLIPTASRSSAVVYSSRVKCLWPAYHNVLKWGQLRYWYLSTDPDFK